MQNKVVILDHPLIQHKLTIMRKTSTSSSEFRALVSEIATLMCYEATRDLPVKEVEVKTPIAVSKTTMIDGDIVIVPILFGAISYIIVMGFSLVLVNWSAI